MNHLTHPEIRQNFINFFKKNNHQYVESSSLIPENDPTLLFTNAGMNQFKNLFLGLEKRNYDKAVSVQKCVRAGGKHNDLDNVGFTARHHTFFEMLGNFSFGDYFKKEAIHYAWQFLTVDLKIPKEKLYVTVFEKDDEAAEIWHKQEGLPKDRIFRLGEKDNFWRMGDVGPCGPSSEIFYDHGPKAGKISDPYQGILSGEDRFVEIWNLVFMQYDEVSPGQLVPLPKPSVDTGSGFERVVAALQGQFSNYDSDLFLPMISKAIEISNKNYITDPEKLRSDQSAREITSAIRVLADHCRSTSFLLADGALPANEGRGYVLRRIMRRAIRYGRKLSQNHSLLVPMSEALIQNMKSEYPYLESRKDIILSTIKDEESRFLQTLDNGTGIFQDEIKKLISLGQKTLPGETVFKLYDTFGFPVDLTALMAAEQNLNLDLSGFEKIMAQSKEKAKSSWKSKSIQADTKHLIELGQKYSSKPTQFVGYDSLVSSSVILALSNGMTEVSELLENDKGYVILDKTPFYAEGGGQIGDQGELISNNLSVQVTDCSKQGVIFLHHVEVKKGILKINSELQAKVKSQSRQQMMAHHSATHLMHAALRSVLGHHVTQAGSLVDESKTRFDFTHNKPLSSEEILKIEILVNSEISKNNKVNAEVMNHKKALELGAMALFGEKYGDEVRVLKMGDFSTELCGGTHVSQTSEIRAFKILSESGVSAGVRRIEAIAGDLAIQFLMSSYEELKQAKSSASVQPDKSLSDWIQTKKEEIKDLQKQIKKIQSSAIDLEQLTSNALNFKFNTVSAKYVFSQLPIDDKEVLSQVADQIKNKIQSGIILLVGEKNENSSYPVIVSVTKDLTSKFQAGVILKEFLNDIGGKGGGRPDFAQGSTSSLSQLDVAKMNLTKKIEST